MGYYGRSSRPAKRSQPKMATQAQQDAFYAATHTVEGNFARGAFVINYSGDLFKVTTIGVRYHEDVRSCLYGCEPVKRPPAEFKATCVLQAAIKTVLGSTQEPGSRGELYVDGKGTGVQMPADAGTIAETWTDSKPNSMASFPRIEVRQGGYLRAVRPNYDDSPTCAWRHDPKLAADVLAAIKIAPQPTAYPSANVKKRDPIANSAE